MASDIASRCQTWRSGPPRRLGAPHRQAPAVLVVSGEPQTCTGTLSAEMALPNLVARLRGGCLGLAEGFVQCALRDSSRHNLSRCTYPRDLATTPTHVRQALIISPEVCVGPARPACRDLVSSGAGARQSAVEASRLVNRPLKRCGRPRSASSLRKYMPWRVLQHAPPPDGDPVPISHCSDAHAAS